MRHVKEIKPSCESFLFLLFEGVKFDKVADKFQGIKFPWKAETHSGKKLNVKIIKLLTHFLLMFYLLVQNRHISSPGWCKIETMFEAEKCKTLRADDSSVSQREKYQKLL